MPLIQIASSAVNAKLVGADRPAKLIVSELLSYTIEGAEHTDAFKTGHWDGRSSFFTHRTATFPAGFVPLVRNRLKKEGYEIQLVKKRLPAPLGPEDPKVDEFEPDPRYDYQPETVRRLLQYGQMIAQVATGGGKSRIAKLAAARIKRPTLFLTTRSVLMYQMKDAFEDCGFKAGVLGDGEWTPRRGVNVGMVQTIAARLEDKTIESEIERYLTNLAAAEQREMDDLKASLTKKKTPKMEIIRQIGALKKHQIAKRIPDKTLGEKIAEKVKRHTVARAKMIKLLEYFEFVILEEAHEAGGNSFYDVMRHCRNAHYRLSLTATPFMRGDAESNMRLMACSGPIGIKISEKMLIERGILATPIFKYANPNKPAKLYKSTSWQRAYKLGIVEAESRNQDVINEVARAVDYGLTSMILVQREAHGKALKKALQARGVRADFIFGEHKQRQRLAALNKLKLGELDVLIGSTILDVGVDVPAVGMVALAGGGKAEVALRQRIGRGLRAKKSGPNFCFILDFTDPHNLHLKGHADTRRAIVEGTPGFAENVLPDDQDYPFEKLGFAPKKAA